MSEFLYHALDGQGRRVSGVVVADSQRAALETLSKNFSLVTRVRSVTPNPLAQALGLWGRVSSESLLGFTHQLAAMLQAGIPIKQALDLLLAEGENPTLQRVVLDVSAAVAAGQPMSTAMRMHPRIFSPFYVSLVEAGEASGNVPEMMARLAATLERAENMRSKVKASLYYPGIVAAFALSVGSLIIVFGIPRVQAIYDGLGAALPPATQALLNATGFLSRFWWVALAVLATAVFAGKQALKEEHLGRWWDAAKLRLPPLGALLRTLATARLARTLGTLYGSGVPILHALELSAGSVGNRAFEHAILEARDRVQEGAGVANSLRGSGLLSEISLGMIASGESSGALDQMLASLASFYEEQSEIRLQAVASLVEPAVMVGVGVMIGTLIVVLGLPFMNLASALA